MTSTRVKFVTIKPWRYDREGNTALFTFRDLFLSELICHLMISQCFPNGLNQCVLWILAFATVKNEREEKQKSMISGIFPSFSNFSNS